MKTNQKITQMKKNYFKLGFLLLLILAVSVTSCRKDDEITRNDVSIIPDTFLDRQNEVLGTVYVENRSMTITVWDHGQIDGDIISVYLNDDKEIDYHTLDGPLNAYSVDVELSYNGYNYILLYAHNEGSISPNTCTVELDDGSLYPQSFILESNLLTNGTVNIVVD